MTLAFESSNLNIQSVILMGILLMTVTDPFFMIGIIYYNLWNIPLLAFHVFFSEPCILDPLIWAQNIGPRITFLLEIMKDYSTPKQALISPISMPPSGSAVFVVCLMLDHYFCLNAHLTQDTTVVAVAPWVWLNVVLYIGRRGIGVDVVRSSRGSIWGTTQHFSVGWDWRK